MQQAVPSSRTRQASPQCQKRIERKNGPSLQKTAARNAKFASKERHKGRFFRKRAPTAGSRKQKPRSPDSLLFPERHFLLFAVLSMQIWHQGGLRRTSRRYGRKGCCPRHDRGPLGIRRVEAARQTPEKMLRKGPTCSNSWISGCMLFRSNVPVKRQGPLVCTLRRILRSIASMGSLARGFAEATIHFVAARNHFATGR